MLPRFWRNLCSNAYAGTALLGLCLASSVLAQTSPIPDAKAVSYPGMVEQFEKLISVVNDRFNNRQNFLTKNGRTFANAQEVGSLELEPDFLNSVILYSDRGYVKLAATAKCRFYDTILTDLLRSTEGKIRNIHVSFVDRNGARESAVINKRDFLNKVVNLECPESKTLIDQFQVNKLDQTLKTINFETPSGKDHCLNIHLGWLSNPKTPYLCQLHEYLKEVRLGQGDPKDLEQRRGVARVLAGKLGMIRQDYLDNLCPNLADPNPFCDGFLNTSFWQKVGAGYQHRIYAEDICSQALQTRQVNDTQLKQCVSRIKQEEDLCLYPAGRANGILPQPNCDLISRAMNHSTMRSNYRDCPQDSDQQVVTNLGRLLLHLTKEEIKPFSGSCSSIPAGVTLAFNKRFDTEENWRYEACFDDRVNRKEVCYRTYFGEYADQPESITRVVARILQATRGADRSISCKLLDSEDYNPLLLDFKSGCFIIYEREKCFLSHCTPKIIFNDRPIDFIKFKGNLKFDYFPNNLRDERFSMQYILTTDFQRKTRSLTSLSTIRDFFRRTQGGLLHGVGCAEELLPGFFRARTLGQCSPLPFIIDGMIDGDSAVFVTRTAVDSLQAPRLISWSNILSAVKSYQQQHPLKLWTLHGLE
jgi:hypothetical protein